MHAENYENNSFFDEVLYSFEEKSRTRDLFKCIRLYISALKSVLLSTRKVISEPITHKDIFGTCSIDYVWRYNRYSFFFLLDIRHSAGNQIQYPRWYLQDIWYPATNFLLNIPYSAGHPVSCRISNSVSEMVPAGYPVSGQKFY